MKNPILSIIIPLYNKAGYIGQCLDSILRQSYTDYELIIINDGSTDESAELVERNFKDNRIKLIHTKNEGVSSARNRGIREANGEFVMFVDADDYVSDNYIANIMGVVDKHHADIYIWGITKNHLDNSQEPITPDLSGTYNRKSFLRQFVKEHYGKKRGLYGYIPNKLIRTSILREHGLAFDSSIKLMEDYDFFLSCYGCCDSFYCFQETGYHYVARQAPPQLRPRLTNYIQLIDIHEKCWSLLFHNDALSTNAPFMEKAIGNLAISTFLEMRKPSAETIRNELRLLKARAHVTDSLTKTQTNKRILKQLILREKPKAIFLYLMIWNKYLMTRSRL